MKDRKIIDVHTSEFDYGELVRVKLERYNGRLELELESERLHTSTVLTPAQALELGEALIVAAAGQEPTP